MRLPAAKANAPSCKRQVTYIPAHPINMGDCLAWARKRHHILARPNDKSGMTLKPCTSAQFQRDLKIRNILDTTKNSSASCVFIIRLLKRFGEPWLPLHRSRELPLFPKLM